MSRFRDNIIWGIRSAVFYSKFYSGLALFVYIVGGGVGFAKAGLKFGPVLVFYLIAPLLAGAVVGALRPLSGNVVGQMLIGAIAAIPVAIGAASRLTSNGTYGLAIRGMMAVDALNVTMSRTGNIGDSPLSSVVNSVYWLPAAKAACNL